MTTACYGALNEYEINTPEYSSELNCGLNSIYQAEYAIHLKLHRQLDPQTLTRRRHSQYVPCSLKCRRKGQPAGAMDD